MSDFTENLQLSTTPTSPRYASPPSSSKNKAKANFPERLPINIEEISEVGNPKERSANQFTTKSSSTTPFRTTTSYTTCSYNSCAISLENTRIESDTNKTIHKTDHHKKKFSDVKNKSKEVWGPIQQDMVSELTLKGYAYLTKTEKHSLSPSTITNLATTEEFPPILRN